MADFEIHGDDEKGITVRWGNTEEHYRILGIRFQSEPIFSWSGPLGNRMHELTSHRQVIELETVHDPIPPEITSEGIWLH